MSDGEPVRQPVKPGDIVAGKYRIEGTLGAGGMAVVLSATQLDLDRLVAIKVMRAELAQVPGAVQRLLLEAKLTARFYSEHICKVLDVGTLADGAPYVVMEYLEGSDLSGLLAERGRFDVVTAVDLMLQACEGIAEAHAAAIIHRDLKPENLFVTNLLDDPPTVKVLDFGISKQLTPRSGGRALTNPSAALGSPYYMAPEQMLAAKDADLRVDVWAIGAIMYELLTGHTPFDGDTLPEVCAAVMHVEARQAWELAPELPRPLCAVIDRCLKKDREQRFSSIAELAGALAPFGSFRAAASLKRIERVLARSTPVSVVVNFDPALVTALPVEPTAARQDTELDLKNAGTTGAASTMVSPPAQPRSAWKVLALVATLGIGIVGAVGVVRGFGHGDSTGHVAAVLADPPLPPQAPVTLSHQSPSLPSDPVAPPSVAVAPLPSAKAVVHVRHSRPAGKRATSEPAASAPAQSSEPKRTSSAVEAWDPASFGPRR